MTAMSSSERLAAKTQEIRRVLSEPTVDLWRLRELALSDGGLVNGMLCNVCSARCWIACQPIDGTATMCSIGEVT